MILQTKHLRNTSLLGLKEDADDELGRLLDEGLFLSDCTLFRLLFCGILDLGASEGSLGFCWLMDPNCANAASSSLDNSSSKLFEL